MGESQSDRRMDVQLLAITALATDKMGEKRLDLLPHPPESHGKLNFSPMKLQLISSHGMWDPPNDTADVRMPS